jgi:hypothetical protein
MKYKTGTKSSIEEMGESSVLIRDPRLGPINVAPQQQYNLSNKKCRAFGIIGVPHYYNTCTNFAPLIQSDSGNLAGKVL